MFDDYRYIADCHEIIGRLIRALKALDDLRFHLGARQTLDSYDDAADCVDRILWSLCGAVDVAARSLHHALKLPGSERKAKFHGDWYSDKFRPAYDQAMGISNVDHTQRALATVFTLRNTVHYRSLSAAGAVKEPAPYVGKERGRVRLLILSDVYEEIDPADHARWGIEQTATTMLPAAADLATGGHISNRCRFLVHRSVELDGRLREHPRQGRSLEAQQLLPSAPRQWTSGDDSAADWLPGVPGEFPPNNPGHQVRPARITTPTSR